MIRVKYYVGETPYQISGVRDLALITLQGISYIDLVSDEPLEVYDRDDHLCSWQTVTANPGRLWTYNVYPQLHNVEFDRMFNAFMRTDDRDRRRVTRFRIKG